MIPRDQDPQLAISPWYLKAVLISGAVSLIGIALGVTAPNSLVREAAAGMTAIASVLFGICFRRFVHYRRMGY
jgi:hypothetical protein